MSEFRSCATCRWYDHEYDNCNRYPKCTGVARDHWCGEWAEAEVTDDYFTVTKVGDEYTFTNAIGAPVFKLTDREDGTTKGVYVPDELDRLKDENECLESENDRLRKTIEDLDNTQIACVKRSLAKAQDENKKLRELLRESLMDYRKYAEKYGLSLCLSDVNEHLNARLRELGIEVEE